MSTIQVTLAQEQEQELKSNIYKLAFKEFEHARKDIGLENRYMNKKETCQYLHISNLTLDKFVTHGLPRIVIGGVVRYDKIAIDKWLEKNMN